MVRLAADGPFVVEIFVLCALVFTLPFALLLVEEAETKIFGALSGSDIETDPGLGGETKARKAFNTDIEYNRSDSFVVDDVRIGLIDVDDGSRRNGVWRDVDRSDFIAIWTSNDDGDRNVCHRISSLRDNPTSRI